MEGGLKVDLKVGNEGKLMIIGILFAISGFGLAIFFYENQILYTISYLFVLIGIVIFTWESLFRKIQPLRLGLSLATITLLSALCLTMITRFLNIVSNEYSFVVFIFSVYAISSLLRSKHKMIEKILFRNLNKQN
jgi:tryptophan-rich sensory protein